VPVGDLCVAADDGGGLATTTDPGGSAPWSVTRLTAWRSFTTANSIDSLSCPAVTLCVGIDGTGDVYSSGDPSGGARRVAPAVLPADGTGSGIACPIAGLPPARAARRTSRPSPVRRRRCAWPATATATC